MSVLVAWTNVRVVAGGSRLRSKQPKLQVGVRMAGVRVVQASLDYIVSKRTLGGKATSGDIEFYGDNCSSCVNHLHCKL